MCLELQLAIASNLVKVHTTRTISTSEIEVFPSNPKRWALLVPHSRFQQTLTVASGVGTASSDTYSFGVAQNSGGKRFWTYLDIGRAIEEQWLGQQSSSANTYNFFEWELPLSIKAMVIKLGLDILNRQP